MATRSSVWLLVPAVLLVPALSLGGCSGGDSDEAGAQPAAASGVGAAPAAGPAADPAAAPAANPGAPAAPAEAPAAAPAAQPAAAAPATVLASSETNWGGVVAEVTEFRRKGNTLTAKVRLRNTGQEQATVEVRFDEVYLMDAANARKYEALRDERGTYIASLRSGFGDRWYEYIEPGEQNLIWVKFPAPPPEVTAVPLQVPQVPPFEDLPIQDH